MALNERVQVDIGARAGGQRLELQKHEFVDPSGAIRPEPLSLTQPQAWIRLYPAVWPSPLRATVGSVVQQGVRVEDVVDETVVFNGSAEGRTKKPVAGGLQIDIQGRAFDVNGQPVQVTITADAQGNLRASQPFHGAAVVSYTSEYRLLRYEYGITPLPNGGARFTAGTVLAWHGGQVASYDVEPLRLGTPEPNVAELYRDVSYTILQEADEFERPPNWPDSGDYPDFPELQGPDPNEGWVEHERPHEIGYIDDACRLSLDTYFVRPAKPFIGTSNYTIPVERKMTSEDQLRSKGFSTSCINRAMQQMEELD